MADETFDGRGIADVVVEWGPGGPHAQREFKSTGVDMLPGLVVTEEGEGAGTWDVDLCAATEKPTGVISKYVINQKADGATRNLDAASIDNESLRVSKCSSGDIVFCTYQATGATKKRGTLLICGSEAGKVAPWAFIATAGATIQETTLATVVGKLAEDVTQDNTNDQKVKVELSIS